MLLNYNRISRTIDATLWEEIRSYVVDSWVMRAPGVLFAVALVPVLQIWMIPMEVSRKRGF